MPKTPKDPQDMTTDEAIKHLFHPKIVEHAKKEADNAKPHVKSTDKKSK